MKEVKYVKCSSYMLLMGYEYTIKDDRNKWNREIKKRKDVR